MDGMGSNGSLVPTLSRSNHGGSLRPVLSLAWLQPEYGLRKGFEHMPGLGKVHLHMWKDVGAQEMSLTLIWALLGIGHLKEAAPLNASQCNLLLGAGRAR